jgi:hypothetical protein
MFTWTRAFAFVTGISLAGVITMSCGGNENASVTGPTSVAVSGGAIATEVAVDTAPPITTFDEEPAPAPPPPEGEPPAPAPEPPPAAPAPPPPPPGTPGRPDPPTVGGDLTLKTDPNPVPYSGRPVGIFSCRDLPHTWYYDQVIHSNVGGHSVIFTAVVQRLPARPHGADPVQGKGFERQSGVIQRTDCPVDGALTRQPASPSTSPAGALLLERSVGIVCD